MGEDQSLLRHGLGIAGRVELFMQDIDLHGELCGFLIKLAEAENLPSEPPVVKVADVVLQMHQVTARPDEDGMEPGREWFDGIFLTMPNRLSLHIQVDNVRGLIRALLLMVSGDSSILQLLDPLGWSEDSIAKGNVEVGHPPIVFNVSVGFSFIYIFIVFDTVVEPTDLLFEMADLAGLLGITSSDGGEEPFSNGSKDVCIEIGVGCQGGCNCTGRHWWFWALDQSDQERDVVLGGRGI